MNDAAPDTPRSPRLSLEDHARIAAQIAERDRPMREILEAEGVDEAEWNDATIYWMKGMAEDASAHGAEASLAIAYSDAFSKTQDALRPVPQMTPEEWAGLTAEILKAGGPARPLAARGLSTADYLRLSRHWAGRLSQDPSQNKRFAAAFQALMA